MRLSRLEVQGFGKLIGTDFDLCPGLNLFVGENESGKSTLQQALLAALYGFYDSGDRGDKLKAAKQAEAHYAPWQSSAHYATGVEYELDDGRRLRLDRRFAGNASDVQLHDVGRAEAIALPADKYGGLSVAAQQQYVGAVRGVFAGSACVDQGKLRDLGSAHGLSEAMVKALDSDEADVSAKDALKLLADTMETDVGGPAAHKKPLRGARDQLERAREDLIAWDAARDAIDGDVRSEVVLAVSVESLRAKVERLLLAKARRQLADQDDLLRRLEAVEPALRALEAERDGLSEWRDFSGPGQGEVAAALARLQGAQERAHDLAGRQAEEAERARSAREQLAQSEAAVTAGEHLAGFPAERQQEVRALHGTWVVASKLLAAAQEQAPVEAEPVAAGGGFSLPVFLLGGLVALVLAVAGVALHLLVPALVVAAIALIVAAAIAARSGTTAPPAVRQTLAPDTNALAAAEQGARERLDAALAEAGAIADGADEAVQRFDAMVEEKRRWQEAGRDAEQARQALAALAAHDEELRAAEGQAALFGQRFDELMAVAGVAEADVQAAYRRYGERLSSHERYVRVEAQAAAARRERSAIAAGRPREQIERDHAEAAQRLAGLMARAGRPDMPVESGLSVGQIDEALAKATAEHHEADTRLGTLRDRIARGLPAGPGRGEIEERVAQWEQEVERLDGFGAALRLATEHLSEAAKEAREDFVPKLNESVSGTVAAITAGHYDHIQLAFSGDNLGISLSGPDTPQLVDVSALSLGTVEQCYIGLRLAIAGLLSEGGERLPLILDDPFVNFDRPRLERMLAFLVELSEQHQVLLFSKDESLPAWFAANAPEPGRVKVFAMGGA